MAINPSYVATPPGLFKIIHIIFGAITIGCGASSFESEYVFERIFLWGAVACFVVSILYLIAHLASEGLSQSNGNKVIDMLYHVLGGVLLIVGGSLMITSVFKYRKDYCEPYPWGDRSDCQPKYQEKLAGGSFAIINGVLYLVTVALVAAAPRNDEPEVEWDKPYRSVHTSRRETTQEETS